jgi:hypothetical protein
MRYLPEPGIKDTCRTSSQNLCRCWEGRFPDIFRRSSVVWGRAATSGSRRWVTSAAGSNAPWAAPIRRRPRHCVPAEVGSTASAPRESVFDDGIIRRQAECSAAALAVLNRDWALPRWETRATREIEYQDGIPSAFEPHQTKRWASRCRAQWVAASRVRTRRRAIPRSGW